MQRFSTALVLIAFLSFLSLTTNKSHATVVAGNPVEFTESSTHAARYLLGQSFNVPTPTTVDGIGIIFKSSYGTNAQVGIYSDNSGSPGNLLAQTATFTPAVGTVEVPLLSSTVMSGDVWFMAIYQDIASIGEASGTNDITTYFRFLNIGTSLPSPYGSSSNYLDRSFNYYLTSNPIPEPSTLILSLIGLALLPLCRRNPRRCSS